MNIWRILSSRSDETFDNLNLKSRNQLQFVKLQKKMKSTESSKNTSGIPSNAYTPIHTHLHTLSPKKPHLPLPPNLNAPTPTQTPNTPKHCNRISPPHKGPKEPRSPLSKLPTLPDVNAKLLHREARFSIVLQPLLEVEGGVIWGKSQRMNESGLLPGFHVVRLYALRDMCRRRRGISRDAEVLENSLGAGGFWEGRFGVGMWCLLFFWRRVEREGESVLNRGSVSRVKCCAMCM